MDRQNFYFGKLVDVPEMHDLQNNIENGINVIKTILGKGIWKGGAISISQNLNLSIEDTVCFDNNGNTIFIGNQILDLSSLVPPIDKKIVSITASFSRNYSQPEQDDQGNNVFFKEDEGCLIEYIESDVSTSPIAPTIPESRVLLADVTLTAGQTQINAGDLNFGRVKKLDSLAKKLIDVFSYIDSQIANHDSQHDDRFYL
ncbi:MAG TPA: hypothetical protein PLO89_00005, partial [Spirochaetota bacterium]|nr:hypothetical protein [Spirochaetota bacterium]